MKIKKTYVLLAFLTVLMVGLFLNYFKYHQYLPSVGIAHAKALDQAAINRIRTQTPITEIHVFKAKRVLQLKHHQSMIKSYNMRLGFAPTGHKVQEGDGKTPEGRYIIDWRNSQSAFYKSLHISYPNQADKNKAVTLGVSPGGDIMIHGSATSSQVNKLPQLMDYFPSNDWTWGCIAIRNTDMDEIWLLVDNGIPIEIHP